MPIDSEQSKTPFRRLMIAQSAPDLRWSRARPRRSVFRSWRQCRAVLGPLQAQHAFSSCWCRRASDPLARGRKMQLPETGRAAKIAKLFPPVDPAKAQQKDRRRRCARRAWGRPVPKQRQGHGGAEDRRAGFGSPQAVPLPQARPAWRRRDLHRHAPRPALSAAADEKQPATPDPGMAGFATPQARPERGRTRAVGKRRRTDPKPLRKSRAAKAEAAVRAAETCGRGKPVITEADAVNQNSGCAQTAGCAAAGADRTPRTFATSNPMAPGNFRANARATGRPT